MRGSRYATLQLQQRRRQQLLQQNMAVRVQILRLLLKVALGQQLQQEGVWTWASGVTHSLHPQQQAEIWQQLLVKLPAGHTLLLLLLLGSMG
jgi:hypothetical protein